ncbi:MAG: hypothetical protein AUJ07_00340 [Crenarchaeota archaeon 13_1_40CM_3_53_5]|nr:MAG: hypothetical protein AUJ07_00340 [Crenarchaeota archaeon 13_1_40CM_3_53_5]
MKMRLVGPLAARRVSPREALDYSAFSMNHSQPGETSELHVFEKFYGANSLVADGFETYTDSEVSDSANQPAIKADVVGRKGEALTLVFCEAGDSKRIEEEALTRIEKSENARAVILVPMGVDVDLSNLGQERIKAGKVVVEPLGWFLRLVDLLGNETRMRMLAPLFRKTGAKKQYRTTINPKLVYKNLTAFLETGLVDEVEHGGYELSELGKSVMADFIAFLERTRRTLDAASKVREVKTK